MNKPETIRSNMLRMSMQISDLHKWCDIIELDDFNEKELKNLDIAYHNAASKLKDLNEVIFNCQKRNKEEGLNIFERANAKQIRKELLAPLSND